MGRDALEGNWTELKGHVRRQWWKLTDDEVDRIEGDREIQISRSQARYGRTREEAQREVEERFKGDAVGRP